MFQPGLVSITFRALMPAQIVALVREAGLRGIEWGGDIHVPHGNVSRAREVRELTVEAGLRVAAYGSYYHAGQSESSGLPFEHVLDCAVELGAPTIRVWAGKVGSAAATPADRARIGDDLRRVAEIARTARITVSLEFHNGTLTDTADSALQLLREVGHPNLFTYWQPPINQGTPDAAADLLRVSPHLTNLHVYQWKPASTTRQPLSEGAERWLAFLHIVGDLPGDRYAMLEFVEGDDPEKFRRDAATLKAWLAGG